MKLRTKLNLLKNAKLHFKNANARIKLIDQTTGEIQIVHDYKQFRKQLKSKTANYNFYFGTRDYDKIIETLENIRDYIEHRFSILSDDEYNDLICGDGILSIVDDGIDEFDKDGCLIQADVDKLCEFCIQMCQEYEQRYE